MLFGVQQAQDGGFIAVGGHPGEMFGAVKTDEFGSSAIASSERHDGEPAPLAMSVSMNGKVRYLLPRQGPMTLAVYDATGRRVQILCRGNQAPGWHELTVQVGAAGLRFLRLTCRDGTTVVSFVNVK